MRALAILVISLLVALPAMSHEGEPHQHYFYCFLQVDLNGGTATVDDGSIKSGSKIFKYSADRELVDEKGNSIEFNTAPDALNYMAAWGWELVEAVSVVQSGGYQGNSVGMTKIIYILKVEYNGEEDNISNHVPPLKADK